MDAKNPNPNKPDKQPRRNQPRHAGAAKKKGPYRTLSDEELDETPCAKTPENEPSSEIESSLIWEEEEEAIKNEAADQFHRRYVDHKKEALELHDLKWYHHYVSRDEATSMLKRIGDYLVRLTPASHKPEFIISVVTRKRKGAAPDVMHIRVLYEESVPDKWYIDFTERQLSMFDLVKYYQKNHSEFSVEPGPLLKNMIGNTGTMIDRNRVELSKEYFDKDLCGYVFKGQYKTSAVSDWSPCVIRQYIFKSLLSEAMKQFFNERYILLHYPHEYLVTMLGYCYKEKPYLIIYEDLLRPLKRFVIVKTDITVEELEMISMEVLSAMNFLQENKIVHRNICSDCIALTPTMKTKLHSFGNAFIGHTLQTKDKSGINVNYIAPEARKKGLYTMKSDVWGFGMLLWEMFHRYKENPIKEKNLVHAIESKLFPFAPHKNMPEALATLYKDCVAIAPEDRPDFTFAWKTLRGENKIKEKK